MQGDLDHSLEQLAELFMNIIIMSRIEREEGDCVVFGQLAEYVVTADFSPRIGRNKSAGLNPKDLHRKELPADSFIGGRRLRTARFLQVNQIDDNLIPTNALLQKVRVDSSGADHDHLSDPQNFLQI